MAIDGGQSPDNLSKPPEFHFSTPASPDAVIPSREGNDKKATEKKQAQIAELFDKLREIPLAETVQTGAKKPEMKFPLADRLGAIFENSAFVSGAESAQKEMIDITKRVIKQKETTQPWNSTATHILLSQLVERGFIPPVGTLERLGVFPINVIRQVGYLISQAKPTSPSK